MIRSGRPLHNTRRGADPSDDMHDARSGVISPTRGLDAEDAKGDDIDNRRHSDADDWELAYFERRGLHGRRGTHGHGQPRSQEGSISAPPPRKNKLLARVEQSRKNRGLSGGGSSGAPRKKLQAERQRV